MIAKLSSLFIILSIMACSQADLTDHVIQPFVKPYSLNQGYITDYEFNVYIPSSVTNAYIEFEFPSLYRLSQKCKAYIKVGHYPYTVYPCFLNADYRYLLLIDSMPSGNYQIIFEGIQNPYIDALSSKFNIRTYMNQTLLIDDVETINPIFFLPPPVTSKNSSIRGIGNVHVNQKTSYDFTFVLEKSLVIGDSIRFNFPEGYTLIEPSCFHKNSGTYIVAKILHNNRSIVCENLPEALTINTFHTINIQGVINPGYAGSFEGFYLETIENLSVHVHGRINIPSSIQINPGKTVLSINSTSRLASLSTTLQFEMRFENKIPADGEIWIKIPPDFLYRDTNCILTLSELEDITCELAVNQTGYTIKGLAGICTNQTVMVSVSMKNPVLPKDYKIRVFSFSTLYNAIIDEASEHMTINPNGNSSAQIEDLSPLFRTPRFLRSSVSLDRRLSLNTPGPLKFIFSVNVPLPPTVPGSTNAIIVDIKPQIALPPSKALKCYFFETVPASSCNWDIISNSDRTTVTIMTPSTGSPLQNDISVTVTTEESGTRYGIILPSVIQRYDFSFYFLNDGDSQAHELYLADYVPDPIEVPNSDISLILAPLQYGQEAYLELVWTNTYQYLGNNHFIELEFVHGTPGWDYNLGWPSLEYYGRHDMPCLAVNLGANYKCYMNPGGAAGINSTIQIIHLDPISLSTIITIRLPKIKFGGSGAAKLRFTVYESTPGDFPPKMAIVYKDYSLTPLPSTGLSPGPSMTITFSTDKPDVDADLTLSFTSDLTDPRFVIYEYPDLFTIPGTTQTKTLPCSTNVCHIFTSENVRWIVFAITNFQGTSASTTLSMHNPPYTGTYYFFARTEKNGPIRDYKRSGIVINPGIPTVSFSINSANSEINKNSLLLFDISTSIITRIPADGLIVFQFINLNVPDGDDFSCQITGINALETVVGIICEKAIPNTVMITNINTVTAGTAIAFTLQLWTTDTSPATVMFRTFYDRSASKIIDTGIATCNLAYQYDNFLSASILNDRSGDIVRANSYGALTLSFTPSNTYSSITMIIEFESDFAFSTNTDVPYCKLNTARKRCSVSSYSPLKIEIPNLDSTSVTANTPVIINLTSDYSDPSVKGIKAPSTSGYKHVSVTLTDTSSGSNIVKETNGQYIYVYPTSVPSFSVAGTCTSADSYTMFNVRFSLKQNLNANTGSTTRGRIYIEFPTGTGNFRDDLGTGLSTGGVIGCIVQIPSSAVETKCRLVKSPGNGLPAAVELIGFDAISAGVSVKVKIAKVKNVQTTLGENVLGLRVEHVTVANGEIIPREYTTYNLWHRVYPLTTIPTTYTAPDVVLGPGSNPNQVGTNMIPEIFSNVGLTSNTPSTDYYIYELPSDFVVTSSVPCPGTISTAQCYSFSEIGWVVYEISGGSFVDANVHVQGTISTVTMPSSFDPNGYTFISYIWKNNALDHYMQHIIQKSYIQTALAGTFSAFSKDIATEQCVKGRTNTEITISFTTFSKIPKAGAIEIRFPSSFVPLPHCKNTPSLGSVLTSSTGRVACTVQANSWLITNFDDVDANQPIRIYGFINLPSSAGIYYLQIKSYGNQHATDIANNGRLIDSLGSGPSIVVQNSNSLELNMGSSLWLNDPIIAKTNNYRPFIFSFILNGMSLTLVNSGVIEITMAAAATAFTSTLPSNGQLVCSFLNPATTEYIACQAISATNSANGYITYSLYPKQTLIANTKYQVTITSVFGSDGIDGIQQPSDAGTYQVSMVAKEGAIQQRELDFYEIVPNKFTQLDVKNYVISPGDEDPIDVSITVTDPILASDRIVVELPTILNNTNLFEENLGRGLEDAQDANCESVSTDPVGITMSCFFQKGNRKAKTPATIVLYGFSGAFTFLRFLFTVINPSVVNYPTVIPLTIYTTRGSNAQLKKIYYQYVERAIVVLSTAADRTNSNQPYYSSSFVSDLSVSLTFTLGSSANLDYSDCFVLKTPPMSSAAYAFTQPINIVAIPTNALIFPKNRFIILKPVNSGASIGGGSSVTVPGLKNPEQVTGNLLVFKGYMTHFGSMTAERMTYSSAVADFLPAALYSAPIYSLWATDVQQNHLLIVSISASYAGIRSVIIKFPSGKVVPRDNCYEHYQNAIPLKQCIADVGNELIYATLEDQTYSSTSSVLKIIVPVKNYITTGTTLSFICSGYTTVETNPANAIGLRFRMNTGPSISSFVYGSSIPAPIFLEADYLSYIENNFYYPTSTFGDFRFKLALPAAIAIGDSFNLYLPSILTFDSTSTTGDILSSPAVILYEPIDIPNKYVMLSASYSTVGVLSFTSTVAINAGRTVSFRVTSMAKVGDSVGVQIPSSYSNTEYNVILEIYSAGSLAYTAQLGHLLLTQAQSFAVVLNPMTRAAGEVTAWEFIINSFSASIDSMFIEFPTMDDFENPLFDVNLGIFSDKDIVPCSSSSKLASLVTPECIFFIGSTSQPARILVRGFQSSGTMILYIAGAKNPAIGRRLYVDLRFYNGYNFHSKSRALGYVTEASNIPAADQVDNANYFVDGNTNYINGGYTFRTPLVIPSASIILVKLDPVCSIGIQTTNKHFLSGTIGNYALMKTTTVSSGSYTFTNFICKKSLGLQFLEYNMMLSVAGISNGERRIGSYNANDATRQGYCTVTLASNFARVSTNINGETGKAKFNIGIGTLNSLFTFNGQNMISSGFVITMTFQNYYFASISDCSAYTGLASASPNKLVQCNADGLTITFRSFGSITGEISLELSYTNSMSYTGPGVLIFKIFGSNTLLAASDFAAYSAITLPLDLSLSTTSTMITPAPPVFASPPMPGKYGTISFTLNQISLPATLSTSGGETMKIGFEKGIFSSLTCSFTSTGSTYGTGCSVSTTGSGDFDYLVVPLASPATLTFLSAITVSTDGTWPNNPRYLYFQVLVADSTGDLYKSNSMIHESIGLQTVTSVTISMLHLATNLPNEIKISITPTTGLDPSKIISCRYYTIDIQAAHLTQIDCACSSPAKCYNFNDGIAKYIDIVPTSLTGTTNLECYVPNVILTSTESMFCRIISTANRARWFTTPSFVITPSGAATSDTHSLDLFLPSPPISTPQSFSTYAKVYSAAKTYQVGSFAYSDFGSGGPIYPCGGLGISVCRSYTAVRNILVMSIEATHAAGTAFDLFSGTATLSSGVSDQVNNYKILNYITYNQIVQSQYSTTLSPANYNPELTSVTHVVDELRRGLLATQKISFSTMSSAIPANSNNIGGRIEITINGITDVSTGCYASYSSKPIKCGLAYSSPTVIITLTNIESIPAGKTIEVFFSGNNPIFSTPTISLLGYSYYDPGQPTSAVKVLVSGTVTPPSYTDNYGVYVPISSVGLFSFVTKTINPASAPIRVRFKLDTDLQATTGQVTIVLPSNEYSWSSTGTLIGYFRTYTSEVDFIQKEAYFITLTGSIGSGFTIVAKPATSLIANIFHELIVLFAQTPNTNSHFNILSADGKNLLAFFDNSGTTFARESVTLYRYRTTPAISIAGFHFTSNSDSDTNTLIFSFVLNSAITTFPTSMIEFEFPSANDIVIKSGLTTSNSQFSCQIIGLDQRSTSVQPPRCRWIPSHIPKIRIENHAAHTVGTSFVVILYDLLNSVVPKNSVNSLDAIISYTDLSAKSRRRLKLMRAFTTTSGPAFSVIDLTGMTASVPYYGAVSTLTQTIVWPAGMGCSFCRLVVQASGWDWKFKGTSNFEFKINGVSQNIYLDLVNNAFTVLSTTIPLAASTSYTFTFSGPNFRNPLITEPNSNIFRMFFSNLNKHLATFLMVLPYSSLSLAGFTGTTSSCDAIDAQFTGGSGGTLACYVDIPVSSPDNVIKIRVAFTTVSQYKEILPYCESYISSGPSTAMGGQLACSFSETSSGAPSLDVSGFNFVTGSRIRVLFRVHLLTTALTVNIVLQGKSNGAFYSLDRQLSYSVDVSAISSGLTATPTLFKTQNFVPSRLPFSAISPFRILTTIEVDLTTTASIVVIPNLIVTTALPQCMLRSVTDDYPLPIITRCIYDSSSYTLRPVSSILSGRYMLLIGSFQSALTQDGVTFPADTNRLSVKVAIYSAGTTLISRDMAYFSMIAAPFSYFKVNQQRNLVGSTNSQVSFTIQPSSTTTDADSGTSEVILVLEFPSHDPDLGASTTTFKADGINYYNGMRSPALIDLALGGSRMASIHFGTSAYPGQIIMSKHIGFPGVQSITSFPLIGNPAPNLPLRINVYLLSYPNGQAYATVLYQASYTNYFYTETGANEISGGDIFRLSNPFPQQITSIILQNKFYASVVDQNVKIYVKLKNSAKGFDYDYTTSAMITCSGYTIEWYRIAYMFYLTPDSDVGSTPTITCTGFKVGSTIETITIETGCHQGNKLLYKSEQSITVSALNPIPSSSSSITRMSPGLDNKMSVNRYQITFDTNSFLLKAGGSLVIVLPQSLATVPGLSEYIYVSGISDKTTGSSPTLIQGTIISGNLKISGFNDYSGVITLTIFLKNMNTGNPQISLRILDENQSIVARADLPTVTISTVGSALDGSVTSFLTDAIDVFVSEKFRLTFKLGIRSALTYATNSKIIITGPASGFLLITPGTEICKYRLAADSFWKRSPCSVSSWTITMPIAQGFDISAGATIYVIITTEDSDYLQSGIMRPSTTSTRYIFNIKTQISTNNIESVYLPMLVYRNPTTIFNLIWYTNGADDETIVEVRFTAPAMLTLGTFFQLDLMTNDEISQVFPDDLGTGATQMRVSGNCAEYPGTNIISNNNMGLQCYIQKGNYATGTPVRIVLRPENAISGSSSVRYYIAKIKNPGAIPGGYIFNVMTKCRDDGYGCPRYRTRGYVAFGKDSPKTLSTTVRAIPDLLASQLLDHNSLTTFSFPLIDQVIPTDAIVIKTNPVNIIIENVCDPEPGTGICIHFPKVGWTFFQPSSTISDNPSASIKFKIDNAQYFDRTNPQDVIIEILSNRGIQQRIKSSHPQYFVKTPTSVVYYPMQDPPYVLINFDNVIFTAIGGIWRNDKVRKIVFTVPSSFTRLSACLAGIDLAMIGSTTYVEFPCKVTGDREITIIINDPSKWSASVGKPVMVYYKGFIPAGSAAGHTASSTITSYTDISLPYVLDEYTGYSLSIDDPPTPIDRDICIPGTPCNLCYKNTQCQNELLSYCTTSTPRSCQPCQDDSHCSHIAGKQKCLSNLKCVECLVSSNCPAGKNCIGYVCSGSALDLKLSHTDHPDTYLIEFPSQLVANTNIPQGLTISLVNIDSTTYKYTLTQLSATVFRIRFTVTQTIPITKLRADFTHPTYIPSYYTAEISTKRIPFITDSEREASETIEAIGAGTAIAMAAAAGSLLVLGSNPALFWAIINLIQTFYYLIFINVDYPANVQFFLNIFTMAGFDFVPNPMTWFDPNIDEESLPVPARFEEYDVSGLFLNNVGNILLIWALVLIIYFFSAFGNKYLNRPSRIARIFFAKMVGWFEWNGLLRTLMTSYPDIAQAAFLQLRVLTFSSGISSSSSLFGTIFAIYGLVFPFLTLLLIKKLSTGKVKSVKKYKALTEEYSSEGKYSKYFATVFLAKWLLIMLSLVFLHNYPYVEIVVLTLMSLAITILLAKFKPHESKRDNNIRIGIEFIFFVMHILIGVLIYDDYKKEFSERKRLDIGWAMISLGGIIMLTELGVIVTEMVDMIKENWKLFRQVIKKEKKNPVKLPKSSEIKLDKAKGRLEMSDTMSENSLVIESSAEKSLFLKNQTPKLQAEISPEKDQSPLDISDTMSENIPANESFMEKKSFLTKRSSKLRFLKPSEVPAEKPQTLDNVPNITSENISIIEGSSEKRSLFMKRQLPKLKNLERSRMLRRPSIKEEDFEKKIDL